MILSNLLRKLFVLLFAYPVSLFWLGLLVRNRQRLPMKGPAIIVANHNSHLDILALYALFPLRVIPLVRPVAAADYFLKSPSLAWFSRKVIGIVPVTRGARAGDDPLEGCRTALERGGILVLFPEGTRGEPEELARLKSGIWHLLRQFPKARVVPVFMRGLGRSMPKGALVPIPFFVDVFIGKTLDFDDDRRRFMQSLTERFHQLRDRSVPGRTTELKQGS